MLQLRLVVLSAPNFWNAEVILFHVFKVLPGLPVISEAKLLPSSVKITFFPCLEIKHFDWSHLIELESSFWVGIA